MARRVKWIVLCFSDQASTSGLALLHMPGLSQTPEVDL